jgi:hypothetical protein
MKVFLAFLSLIIVASIAVVVLSSLTTATTLPHSAQSAAVLVQDEQPEIAVLPGTLERISWPAIFAGTILSLVLLYMFNMIGLALGLTQINPEYGEDTPSTKTLLTESAVWIGGSYAVAVFLGGWLAARGAGIPDNTDGVIHGLLTWAFVELITAIFVMLGIGRMVSGLASLVGTGLKVAGTLTSETAQVAADVASGAGSVTAQALATLAHGMQTSAQVAANGMSQVTDAAIENSPDVQETLGLQDMTFEEIEMEARQLLRQAGIEPRQLERDVSETVDDARRAAVLAMKYPDEADRILNLTLRRLLRRGRETASEVDRDALVNLLTQNTNMTEREVRSRLNEWENRYARMREQTERARSEAQRKAQELQAQAQQKAQEIYKDVQDYVNQMEQKAEQRIKQAQQEAEEKAREAAGRSADVFSKIAAAVAAAMILGAIAAGFGGLVGVPEELPEAEVDNVSFSEVSGTSQTTGDLQFGDEVGW